MEFPRALEIMNIEKNCVIRTSTGTCNMDCANCENYIEATDQIEAYQMARFALEQLIYGNRGFHII